MASLLQNSVRIARAVGTNQVARLFPSMYVQLTRQTGRGDRRRANPPPLEAYQRSARDRYAGPAISCRTLRAAAAGSGSPVIGRPTTSQRAPAPIAAAGVAIHC